MKYLIPQRTFRQRKSHIPRLVALFTVMVLSSVVNPVIANVNIPQSKDQNLPGKIVWHDLFTHDLESSSRFYQELFGWSFVDSLSGNAKVKHIFSGDNHIGNVIEIKPLTTNTSESQWLNYMSVEDIDEATKRVEDNNGIIQIPVRELPQRGSVAVCLDSQKAVFAIIRPNKGESLAEQKELNSWLGSELWTNDLTGAQTFYGNLVGYNMQTITMRNGESYQVFMGDGKARAGIVKIPFDDVQPNWVPYIAVKDAMAVTEKAVQLGGHLLTEVDRDLPENAAVIIADSSGAVFGIQQVELVNSNEGDKNVSH